MRRHVSTYRGVTSHNDHHRQISVDLHKFYDEVPPYLMKSRTSYRAHEINLTFMKSPVRLIYTFYHTNKVVWRRSYTLINGFITLSNKLYEKFQINNVSATVWLSSIRNENSLVCSSFENGMARKSKDVPLRRSNMDLSYNRANESLQSVWIMQELYMENIRYQNEIMIWKITLTRQWFASLFLRLISTWAIINWAITLNAKYHVQLMTKHAKN